MKHVFKRTSGLTEAHHHYCSGCTHGIIHRLVGEVLEEADLLDRTIGVAPVGCAVLAYNYFNCDMQQAAHGRAPAVATGIKRVLPDRVVFTYQGDGDLASIGLAEILHAAARGEGFTVIFANNAIYGMTGGQMAPTTLPGQTTSTTPSGRDVEVTGFPFKVVEMLDTLEAPRFLARVSVHNPTEVRKAKKAIQRAFQIQTEQNGFGLVEILSTCPTNWKMTPIEALNWVGETMVKTYPLGLLRDREG